MPAQEVKESQSFFHSQRWKTEIKMIRTCLVGCENNKESEGWGENIIDINAWRRVVKEAKADQRIQC